MASGAFTIDSTTRVAHGNMVQISGTIEVDTSAGTAAIFPKGYIVDFKINRNIDDMDVAVPRAHINSSDFSGTVANGSVHIDGNAGAPDTFAWTALAIL